MFANGMLVYGGHTEQRELARMDEVEGYTRETPCGRRCSKLKTGRGETKGEPEPEAVISRVHHAPGTQRIVRILF